MPRGGGTDTGSKGRGQARGRDFHQCISSLQQCVIWAAFQTKDSKSSQSFSSPREVGPVGPEPERQTIIDDAYVCARARSNSLARSARFMVSSRFERGDVRSRI